MASRRVLWIDDEIETLRSHLLFLKAKDFDVTPVTNGEDGLALLEEETFDAVLLDHRMAGMDGLSVLEAIKTIRPHLPVIMITQSREDALIEDALRHRVDDFLIKPVQAVQVVGTLRRVIEQERIVEAALPKQFIAEYTALQNLKNNARHWRDWMELYSRLVVWDMRHDDLERAGLGEMHRQLHEECNALFADYYLANYEAWTRGEDSPTLSVDVLDHFVLPHVERGSQVYFVVIDCLRLDQWLTIEPILADYFHIERALYYAILPSATNYARNALFAGMFPAQIAERYPQFWIEAPEEETSTNRYEKQLLELKLQRRGLYLKPPPRYFKIFDALGGEEYRKRVASYDRVSLASLVVNFLDILTHERSQSEVLQQIAPDEKAFRSLLLSWFQNSDLLEIFKILATKNAVVIVTTDHGSILCNRATRAYGNRETTTSLRFKLGEEVDCDESESFKLREPERFQLPNDFPRKTYIFAREDFYFVYPTQYHEYKRQLRGGFQHGGVSMEEIIVPCVTLRPR